MTFSPFRYLSLALAFGAVLAIVACNKTGGGAGATGAGLGLSDNGYSLGDPKSAVTVIEYGSLTCPHCAHWEEETWPAFKAKYVDTNKVHYIFREVMIHPEYDAAAALLVRCVPADKYLPTVQAVFRAQTQMFQGGQGSVRDALLNVAKSEGMSEAQFTTCLSNTDALKGVQARQQLVDDAKIQSTPTFVINGKMEDNTVDETIERLSAAIDPLLKK